MAGVANPSLTARITIDTSNYDRGMKNAGKKADTFEKKMKSISQKLTSVGQKMSLAITAPLAAGAVVAINAASDLEESISKVNVVFEDSAAEIVKWSEDAAMAMGLSQQKALEAAGTYGNLFRSLGVAGEASADMSTHLVQLSADLASFNNANPEEVLQALQSGLVGSIEPLRKFGIELSAAAVEQKAVELGLISVGDEMNEAQKLTARYAVIMEQSSLAQGDFARTSEGLANQQRIMEAQLSDVAAQLGQVLLPIAIEVVGVFNEWLTALREMDPEQQELIVGLGLVAAVVGPVLIVFGQLAGAISSITGLLGGGAAAGGAAGAAGGVGLTGALGVLGTVLGTMTIGLTALVGVFTAVSSAAEWMNEKIDGLGTAFKTLVYIALPSLFALENVMKQLGLVTETETTKMANSTGLATAFMNTALGTTSGVIDAMASVTANAAPSVANNLAAMAESIRSSMASAGSSISITGKLMEAVGELAAGSIEAAISAAKQMDVMGTAASSVGGGGTLMTPYGPVTQEQIAASGKGSFLYQIRMGMLDPLGTFTPPDYTPRGGGGGGTGPRDQYGNPIPLYGGGGGGGGGIGSSPGSPVDSVPGLLGLTGDEPWFADILAVVEEIRDIMLLGNGITVDAAGTTQGLLEAFRETGDQ